jgi:2-phosphoglycerate kinase
MPAWRALLLGGTTAAGKSTAAAALARRLGISCISGDSVWRALLAVTTPETHPVLHEWPRAEVTPRDPERLTALHIEEAEIMTPVLEAFIDKELQEGNRFVFHAAWITPALAARICASSGDARAVLIEEPSEERILASMVARSGRREPSERQLVIAEVARLYGAWLRKEATRLHLPLVPASPQETLAKRIIEAAGEEGA